ncbi:hypothetical protein ABB34_05155 [Stenotrophomonas daejeonensis]|uniref:Uncharacterized protein n=2 Tax=Stenotrophomonas daejeonensis TaxID=659018 RepID=A0A0R0E005_9GAMM|nr:hypothetical protein ABB34_05155 [Stenotrophomonas daejeonensis]
MATYPTLLKALRKNYISSVYIAHALFVMLLLAIVHYRRKIGTALLWPITRALSLLGKAHEKI